MTVIAYRGGVLAADSMEVREEHLKMLNSKKAIKKLGYLFGVSGELCPNNDALMKWFFAKKGTEKRAVYHSMKFDLLVVTPEGVIQVWDQTGSYDVIKSEFYAIGSGKEFAIGAMEMGATAVEAVNVAIRWCPTAGGRVTSKKL